MATLHGMPGAYGKTEALRKFDRILALMLLVLVGMSFGFGLGYGILGFRSWYLLIAIPLIGAVAWGGLRLLHEPLNEQGQPLVGRILGDHTVPEPSSNLAVCPSDPSDWRRQRRVHVSVLSGCAPTL